jgi:hypothetical protein
MLDKPFTHEPAWQKPLEQAWRSSQSMLAGKDRGMQQGMVTAEMEPLYDMLITGTWVLFQDIISNELFARGLSQARFTDHAGFAGHFLLVTHQLWALRLAFWSDPAISKLVGKDFPGFCSEFCAVTDCGADLVLASFDATQTFLEKEPGNLLGAMDFQTFSLLQLLTDQRYTAQYWNDMQVADLTAITQRIQAGRLQQIKTAKEMMGLSGPFIEPSALDPSR